MCLGSKNAHWKNYAKCWSDGCRIGEIAIEFGRIGDISWISTRSSLEMVQKGLTMACFHAIIHRHLRVRRYRGVEQLEARRAHNPEVVGSSPASATIKSPEIVRFQDFFLRFRYRKVQSKILRFCRTAFDPYSDP